MSMTPSEQWPRPNCLLTFGRWIFVAAAMVAIWFVIIRAVARYIHQIG